MSGTSMATQEHLAHLFCFYERYKNIYGTNCFASLMALVSNTAKDNGNQDRITNMVLGI
jgi:hypothetical protein